MALGLLDTPAKYRLYLEDYLHLQDAEGFGSRRTELLDGDIWFRTLRFAPEARVTTELGLRMHNRMIKQNGLNVGILGSIGLPPHDAPSPDLTIWRDDGGDGLIPRDAVALVVEVAGQTLERDLNQKLAIYARHDIPEYWVADVNARVIHQMWAPSGEAYSERCQVPFGERIAAATIAGLAVETAGLA